MNMILSVLLIGCIWLYFKNKDNQATDYMNNHKIDYGKMNDDKALNDLSRDQVNQNIIDGKYNDYTKN